MIFYFRIDSFNQQIVIKFKEETREVFGAQFCMVLKLGPIVKNYYIESMTREYPNTIIRRKTNWIGRMLCRNAV